MTFPRIGVGVLNDIFAKCERVSNILIRALRRDFATYEQSVINRNSFGFGVEINIFGSAIYVTGGNVFFQTRDRYKSGVLVLAALSLCIVDCLAVCRNFIAAANFLRKYRRAFGNIPHSVAVNAFCNPAVFEERIAAVAFVVEDNIRSAERTFRNRNLLANERNVISNSRFNALLETGDCRDSIATSLCRFAQSRRSLFVDYPTCRLGVLKRDCRAAEIRFRIVEGLRCNRIINCKCVGCVLIAALYRDFALGI